jgi:hypothetical protein
MEITVIASELDRQVAEVVDLLAAGGQPAELEAATLELAAWFELWREASGLPDAGIWREAGRASQGGIPVRMRAPGIPSRLACRGFRRCRLPAQLTPDRPDCVAQPEDVADACYSPQPAAECIYRSLRVEGSVMTKQMN